jgi:hypothetical protein
MIVDSLFYTDNSVVLVTVLRDSLIRFRYTTKDISVMTFPTLLIKVHSWIYFAVT